MLKPKVTAARVVWVRFMTILSKRSWEESVQELCSLLLKFAVPVIKFVVVELIPLRGGNELGTRFSSLHRLACLRNRWVLALFYVGLLYSSVFTVI